MLFIIFAIIYWLSSPAQATPYDYFTRLADAFLQGKIYLEDNPPWLNELIPIAENKYYVPYPPMPAIVSLPFRLLLNGLFKQQWLAHLLGAGTVVLSVLLSKQYFSKDRKKQIWIGLFVGLSTVLWFLSSVGSSWYLGQVTAAFFLTAALVTAHKNKPAMTGILLGAAYLSRIHTILSLPLFIYILWSKNKNLKKLLPFAVYLLLFVLFNFLYNYARFGVIWDKGYMLIPGVLDEPWYEVGIIHPSYIPRHLDVLLLSLPHFQKEFPFAIPRWTGMALWLTTPAIFLSIFAPLKENVTRFIWLAIFLVSGPILMHGTNGFAQLGYRFFIDLLPLFTLLMIIRLQKAKLTKLHWLLLLFGILVNLWGVVLINKFEIVMV